MGFIKILLVLILLPFTFIGQEESAFKYGIVGGIEIGLFTTNFPDSDAARSTTRPTVGVLGNYMYSNKWGTTAELVFQYRNVRIADNDSNDSFGGGYLLIPLLLEYVVDEKLSLQAGPRIGILVSEYSLARERGFEANLIALGPALGIKYNFSNHWFLNIRATYELTEVIKDSGTNTLGFGFQVGYFF